MVSRNMVVLGEPDASCLARLLGWSVLLFKSLYLELVSYVLLLCFFIPVWVCLVLG